jgi:hypothetical protein
MLFWETVVFVARIIWNTEIHCVGTMQFFLTLTQMFHIIIIVFIGLRETSDSSSTNMKYFRGRTALAIRHRLEVRTSVLPFKDCGSLKRSIWLSVVTFHKRYLRHRIPKLFGRQNCLNSTKRHQQLLQCSVSWCLRWWSLQKSFDWENRWWVGGRGIRVEGKTERPHRACATRLFYTLWLSLLLLETKFQLWRGGTPPYRDKARSFTETAIMKRIVLSVAPRWN